MKCEEARNTLPLFLYGELAFEEEERLEMHIDECAGCRIALEREKSLFKSLDAAEAWNPEGLVPRTVRALSGRGAGVADSRRGGVDPHPAILCPPLRDVRRAEIGDVAQATHVEQPGNAAFHFQDPVTAQLLQRTIEVDDA